MTSLINTGRFGVNPELKRMTAFVSDFGPDFEFAQIYPDSADEGLTLVSQRTGQEVDWVVDDVHRSEEGIDYWVLVPAEGSPESVRGWKLYIYND